MIKYFPFFSPLSPRRLEPIVQPLNPATATDKTESPRRKRKNKKRSTKQDPNTNAAEVEGDESPRPLPSPRLVGSVGGMNTSVTEPHRIGTNNSTHGMQHDISPNRPASIEVTGGPRPLPAIRKQ